MNQLQKKFTILVVDDIDDQRNSIVSYLRKEFKEAFVISANSAESTKKILESKENLFDCIINNSTDTNDKLVEEIDKARVSFKPFLNALYPNGGYLQSHEWKTIKYDNYGDNIEKVLEKYYSLEYGHLEDQEHLEEKVIELKKLLKEQSILNESLVYEDYENYISDNPHCLQIVCIIVDMIDERITSAKTSVFMGLDVFVNIEKLKRDTDKFEDFKNLQVIFYTGQLGFAFDFKAELSKSFPDKEWTSNENIELDIMRNLKTIILRKNAQDGLQLIRTVYQCIWNVDK